MRKNEQMKKTQITQNTRIQIAISNLINTFIFILLYNVAIGEIPDSSNIIKDGK